MIERYSLHFPQEATNRPVVHELCSRYGLKVNIFNADIGAGREGTMIVDFESSRQSIDAAIEFLGRTGISCMSIRKRLEVNEENCVHCGACTAVCFSSCLTIDNLAAELAINREKCVLCGLCEQACPLGLIRIYYKG